ncbi:tripartite-type tricarboxylate transporter receptor subunit TctC [Stella humosa]|uniref:Tripartite-type tricarboxylate transporter receptor subunit TctC n=1 Tax=Stella humosa TaxID=94 RepID=A0A3N1LWR5_9PROT|nr:tripartite tricarboxylate transporter substrate-binding protein [Stella humosa]ROP99623.1 tripartite-type tricarboxylate transporter receptor subunit TctC [Stella humosa]BBK31152.1 MFS transporter [Stella humosa]
MIEQVGRHLRRLATLAAALLAPCMLAPAAVSAEQPGRAIRLLVGYPPGGSADLLARKLAEPLAAELGRPVVVDNKAGAGGNIAMDILAKAPPDGQTLALSPIGPVVINPVLMTGRMPYDAVRAFTPITQIWDQPLAIIARPDTGPAPGTLQDWLRRHPQATYGTPGIGSTQHMVGEMLSQALGLRLRHVAYRGTVQAATDLMAGAIDLSIDTAFGAAVSGQDGRVVAVATSGRQRSSLLPAAPTLVEGGTPVVVSSWMAMFAPAGLPPEQAERLNAATNRILATPGMAAWFAEIGVTPAGTSAARFAAFLDAERQRWEQAIRQAGVTLD